MKLLNKHSIKSKIIILSRIFFLLILLLLILVIQFILQPKDRKDDNPCFQIINFYKEKENSLDAVFVGSSSCYAFYSPLFAYNSYGLLSSNYSSSGMGVIAYKYAIEEIRKTQKDALIVISVTPNDKMDYSYLHYLTDNMPLSFTKIRLINDFFHFNNETIFDSIGYYYTLLDFHDRWKDIDIDDFIIDDGMKASNEYSSYMENITNVSNDIYITYEKDSSDSDYTKLMKDLIEYCSEKEHNILFIFPPRDYNEQKNKQTNYLIDYIVDNGFDVLDLRDKASLIGLDLKRDYYDLWHTNIHGSIKYSKYLANYLMEKYNFVSSEDNEFTKAYNNYMKVFNPYVLDFELFNDARDYNIEEPNVNIVRKDNKYFAEWEIIKYADGYCIYQKEDNMWKKIGETNDNEYSVSPGTYTIVGYRNETDGRKYGNYDYIGYSVGEQ